MLSDLYDDLFGGIQLDSFVDSWFFQELVVFTGTVDLVAQLSQSIHFFALTLVEGCRCQTDHTDVVAFSSFVEGLEVSQHDGIALVYNDDGLRQTVAPPDPHLVGHSVAEVLGSTGVFKDLEMRVQICVTFHKTVVLEHDFDVALLMLQEHVREGSVDSALAFGRSDYPNLSWELGFVYVSHGSYRALIVVQGQLYLRENFGCTFRRWSDAFLQPAKALIHVEQLLVRLRKMVAISKLDSLLLLLRGLDPLVKSDCS